MVDSNFDTVNRRQAATLILCNPAADKHWTQMLDSIVTLLVLNEDEDTEDLKYLLCSSLAKLSSDFPAKYKNIIEESLSEDKVAFLLKLCAGYDFEIV